MVLAAVKIAAGLAGHSYALIADGAESILDIFSSLLVIAGLRIASRPPDANHPFGHGKAESLAAVAVATLLLLVAVGLAVQSVREIVTPHRTPAPFTLVVLVAVVVVKELVFRLLSRKGRELGSTSLRADAWHHRSDALTSAAAFVGISIALAGGPAYAGADDWAALAACGVIAWNGARILRDAAGEIMDAAAPDDVLTALVARARAVHGVADVETCVARKSGPGWLVDLHVEVDGALTVTEGHAIAHRVKDALLDGGEPRVLDTIVHVEPAARPADAAHSPSAGSSASER